MNEERIHSTAQPSAKLPRVLPKQQPDNIVLLHQDQPEPLVTQEEDHMLALLENQEEEIRRLNGESQDLHAEVARLNRLVHQRDRTTALRESANGNFMQAAIEVRKDAQLIERRACALRDQAQEAISRFSASQALYEGRILQLNQLVASLQGNQQMTYTLEGENAQLRQQLAAAEAATESARNERNRLLDNIEADNTRVLRELEERVINNGVSR